VTSRSFTWERAPWSRCAQCREHTFGFLSGGDHSIVWRCSRCQYRVDEPLAEVDKKVIYIDQFVFSELFKLKAGTRREDKLTPFWTEVDTLLHRVVHLQQAILPHSNIHHAETVVSPWPRELREAYEAIGGDIRFEDTCDVQMREIAEFASAYVEQRDPNFTFDVDDILSGERNRWLPNMRVVVGVDYSRFAAGTRRRRDSVGTSVNELMENWRAQGLGFDEVLNIELNSYHHSRIDALKAWRESYERAEAAEDMMAIINHSMSHICRELSILDRLFKRAGIPESSHDIARNSFWKWERNSEMPFGRILAYMFAALAGQVKAGRKNGVSPGFMNDVETVAAYAPFVDAMFIDKECATLLTQGRPGRELNFRARIFSHTNRDEFLDYLRGLEAQADEEMRRHAQIIYGLEPSPAPD
jgi:hypothetical protein